MRAIAAAGQCVVGGVAFAVDDVGDVGAGFAGGRLAGHAGSVTSVRATEADARRRSTARR
jgi:hypothetical protein